MNFNQPVPETRLSELSLHPGRKRRAGVSKLTAGEFGFSSDSLITLSYGMRGTDPLRCQRDCAASVCMCPRSKLWRPTWVWEPVYGNWHSMAGFISIGTGLITGVWTMGRRKDKGRPRFGAVPCKPSSSPDPWLPGRNQGWTLTLDNNIFVRRISCWEENRTVCQQPDECRIQLQLQSYTSEQTSRVVCDEQCSAVKNCCVRRDLKDLAEFTDRPMGYYTW